ncbi:glycosyltransferase [Micromonospora sp. NPDC050980]|uniref:glycosyltransferase n=1 Tax=Micromonospora sp. NPDC050980 TaxID=3155161 RepID=UPI0033CC20E8
MRILISTIDAASHLRVLAPVALAALAGGHEVLVAAPAGLRHEAGAHGLDFAPVGEDWTRDAVTVEAIGRQLAFGAHRDYNSTLVERVFLGEPALSAAADLQRLIRAWQPDVLLRVAEEFGGYLAAERAGLPHAAVASGYTHLLGPTAVRAPLRRLRERYGLPDTDAPDPYPWLLAAFTPPGYEDHPTPGTLRRYRQAQPDRAGERLPGWVGRLPSDRPLVFAAFGSVVPDVDWKMRPLAGTVLAALGALDCVAVVAAGSTAANLHSGWEHVRVVDRVAQPLLLEAADLFVTHAGFGSVREGLRAGVPMMAVPVIGDEPYHADRCARLGVAGVLPAANLRPQRLTAACADVLSTPSYREAARVVQRRLLALPPVDVLVADLVTLARTGRGPAPAAQPVTATFCGGFT